MIELLYQAAMERDNTAVEDASSIIAYETVLEYPCVMEQRPGTISEPEKITQHISAGGAPR